jgi:5-methylcytosine-specific restriction enzyme B
MAVRRTPEPIRLLDADALNIGRIAAIEEHGSNRPDDPPLDPHHPRLLEVRDLLESYGGVIFSGPPGTSKSWFASKIALALTRDPSRVTYLQFHPSYQYEDFIQGFVPNDSGEGFTMKPKVLLRMCAEARKNPDQSYVLVIDELSRADPGRVFGEALTYIEHSKRNLPFKLASGKTVIIPPNLLLLATMNPLDRGVDEVDAAFERRFAKIAMEPDPSILQEFLSANGAEESLRQHLLSFFRKANARAKHNPLAAIGHTFFIDVNDEESLQRVWDYQLRFLFEKAYRLDPEGLAEMVASWERIFRSSENEGVTADAA